MRLFCYNIIFLIFLRTFVEIKGIIIYKFITIQLMYLVLTAYLWNIACLREKIEKDIIIFLVILILVTGCAVGGADLQSLF